MIGEVSIVEVLIFIVISILLSSCLKPLKTNPVGPPPPDTSSGISFSKQVQPIFTSNCALPGTCHMGSSPADGMSLEFGKAYSNIVNMPNIEFGNYLIVKPFFSDSSYLYFKITGNTIAGPRMPLGKQPLPDSLIHTIKSWIDEGAKNN